MTDPRIEQVAKIITGHTEGDDTWTLWVVEAAQIIELLTTPGGPEISTDEAGGNTPGSSPSPSRSPEGAQ